MSGHPSAKLVVRHIVRGPEIAALRTQPAYRKASTQMLLALTAGRLALTEYAGPKPRLALVVGTVYGELESTAAFLEAWALSKLARPILFQSSLHNATAGFVSLDLGLTGPSFTVSQGAGSRARAIELGHDLLAAGVCDACLVIAVDSPVSALEPYLDPPVATQADARLFVRGEPGSREGAPT